MPTKNEIKAARESLGLSQAAAAKLADLGSQSRWAEYEGGARAMPVWRWDLFRRNTGLLLSLIEAARLAHDSSGELWFRPVSWKGTGNALRFSGDMLVEDQNGHAHAAFSYDRLVGEWSVVPIEVVISERGESWPLQ